MARMYSQSDLVSCTTRLKSRIQEWSVKRRQTVHTLRRLADELMEHHKNVHIAKVAGSTFSIGGFALIATGFGLAPVTLGISTILSAVGGALCGGGGATVAGSSFAKSQIFKNKLADAQKIIEQDREAQKPVEELYEFCCQVANLARNVDKLVKNLADLGRSLNAGTTVATATAGDGAEAILRSLGIAGNTARIGLFAVSAVLLPFDIYTMVNSSMEIDSARKGNRDSEPEAVKKLRHIADALETEMNDMRRAADKL